MPDASSNTLLVDFGAAIRRLRTDRGLSQERLADLAGVHRTYLGDIERGLRNVSLINISRLASGLTVDMATLMTEVEKTRGG